METNLRAPKGIILGKDEKGFLVADDNQHVFVFGPTGSGKGVSFVIPNLLFWEGSAVVHDIKRENFEVTSGWRKKMGQQVYLWNPASKEGESHCYNPLDWVSSDPVQMVDDVQRIAHFILPEREFWSNEARILFTGVVLWCLKTGHKPTSLGEIVRILRTDALAHKLTAILDTEDQNLHPIAYINISSFLQKADAERSGVLSFLSSALELWTNPVIDKLTSESDFNIRKLGDEKITIYVCVPADSTERLRPLLHIFYDQLTSVLCQKRKQEPSQSLSVLLMMDDFITLGAIESFDRGINYFRSYNVKFCTIVQSPSQIDGVYYNYINSFLSNSTYRIAYAPNDQKTAQLICDMTYIKEKCSTSMELTGFSGSEIYALPKNKQIVMVEADSALIADKIFYFEDPIFKERLLPPVKISKQKIKLTLNSSSERTKRRWSFVRWHYNQGK